MLGTLDPRQVGGLEPSLEHVPYAVRSATAPTTLEELDDIVPEEYESSSDEDDGESVSKHKLDKGKQKQQEKLQPGMARIIRDENGNVLKIVVGTEEGQEVEEDIVEPSRGGEDSEDEDEDDGEDEEQPWGEAMKDWDVTEDKIAEEDQEMPDEQVERDPRKVKQGIPIEGALHKVHAKTDVVRGE